MNVRRAVVNFFLKGLLDTICKVDNREFIEALAKNKPLILAVNHINFLEVPLLVTHSYPVYVTGIVKSETWDNPFFSFIFNTYRAIPINRQGAFQGVFTQVRKAMDSGFFVCIAPEGTRSKDGVLGKGKAGIVHLALDADAAVLPVVHYGGENVWSNIKHFKRTPFCFKVGQPFRIKFDGRPDRETREQILDEVMGQLDKLLPEKMRGAYIQQSYTQPRYLDFD
jgi:1-acyl-sn-glycerol-3-phosphate acyltransferase